MWIEEISSSDHAPWNVAAPTPTRGEVKEVVPSIELRDDDVFEPTVSIPRDIINALAKDIQQFKDISFGDPAPGKVAALAWAWREGKNVVPSIKHGFGYMMSSKSYAQDLRKEVQNLAEETERVNNAVEEAKNNARNVYSHVTDWQASAEEALEEAQDLLDDFEGMSETCCYGTLRSPSFRYQFSRKAKDKIEDIQKLALEGGKFKELYDIFSTPAPGNVAAPNPARREGKEVVRSTTATASASSASTSIKLGDDGVFISRAKIIRVIMDALADNSNSVVGVYGMGGIGKSTLSVDVERKVRDEKSFHWVAKADVSENPDIKTIQGEIADALGLTEIKDKETISGRAKLLHDRLKDEEGEKKKVLIILDNLWEGLDLKKVGIPCRHDNKVMGCKLLLTSRHRDVLRRDMGCDKDFSLGGLKDEEAKRLFEKIVEDKVHDDEFKSWVNVALDKCAGVPFLIVAMAKRFKDAELYEWRNTLKNFEEFRDKETSDLINHMLQWSYDKLEEDAKSLLRLCVVYSISKPSLENLVRYGFGLGLFGEVSSMEVARDRLRLQIRTLQASSLLLDSEDVDGFKIHDLVREFVASVASRDHPIFVLKDKDKSIIELPKDKLNSYRAVCFPYVDMEELPQELDSSELQIFLLFTNNRSLKVPYSLFHSMRKLTVLNLTGICLTCSSLSPFQFLENLHTLCLDDCSLDDVAILGELKGLHILSFVNSNIYRLPREIGQLTELKLLDLNHCEKLEIIKPGVLQSLIKLEELYMRNSFTQWNTMEQTPLTNASLIELNHMKNLHTLHVSIPNLSVLPEDLNVKKLTKYEIQIGNAWGWSSKLKGLRTLEIKSDPLGNILRKGCIQSILGKIDNLLLEQLDGSEQSICVLSQNGFPELKHLEVMNSPSVHYIHQSPSHTHFKMLESLLLMNLINLEKLCNGHISSKSFSTLKVVRVQRCDKMEVLFPFSVVRGLPQLEEIKVVDCKRMQGIVDADDGGKVELHNLRVLELYNLPYIKSLFAIGTAPLSSTLHDQVGTQIAFFNEQQVAFSSLETLVIDGLDNAKFLFFPSMIKSLAQLRDLNICNCKKMEAIIMEEEESGLETSETLEFPMLTKFNLLNLESLMRFSHGKGSREAQSQDRFKTYSIALFSREVAFPNLETLDVVGLNNIEMIWDDQIAVDTFPKLKSLCVDCCNKLVNVVHSFILGRLLSLERLDAKRCGSLEVVFELQTPNYLDGHPIALPLKELMLLELPKLKCVWDKELHHQVKFQCLHSIRIFECKSLTSLFPASVAKDLTQLEKLTIKECGIAEIIEKEEGLVPSFVFPMLTSLELRYLRALKCLYTRAHTSHWPALKTLVVCGCDKVEILASHPENEMPLDKPPLFLIEKVAFPSLETLSISGMHNIKIIWDNQVAADSFPKLKSLYVHKCNKFVTIVPSFILERLLCLESLVVEACTSLEVVFKLKPLNPLGGHLVALPLKKLTISKLPKLKCIWDKELHQVKFQCLRYVSVYKCKSLTSLFPTLVAKNLIQLEELEIDKCGIVELIANEEGLVPRFDFPKLTSLKLELLTELKCIYLGRHTLHWPALETLEVCGCNKVEIFGSQPKNEMLLHKQPLFLIEKVAFQRLGTLEIIGLDNLEFIFSLSMFKSLTQLKKLTVSNCEKIEAIIMEEEGLGMETSESLAFPMLTNLHLKHLKSLTCFSRGKGARESRSQDRIISHATALFNQEVVFPNLENLYIKGMNNIEMIWDDQIPANSFSKLKLLLVKECKKLVNIVPSFILGRLLSLETLTAKACCSLEVVFKLQPLNPLDGHGVAHSPLKELKLNDLSKLNCVWDKELHCHVKFQCLRLVTLQRCARLASLFSASIARDLIQLEELEINQCGIVELIEKEGPNELRINVEAIEGPCHELKVSSSFPSYFQHMKTLDVSHCHGLSNMFTPTMATNLVELTKLRISECEILTEVISDEGGKEGHVVAFNQLKYMEFDRLTRLRCFSLGGYTLMFPLLEDIYVNRCPNMNSFSEGPIEVPKLDRVQVGLNERYGETNCQYFLKGNLNTTIQTMFEEMATFAGTKFMRLFEFSELIGKWHNELNPITSSWRLESLVVDKCPFINAIPSRLMLVLERMTFLQVRDCEALEEIFNLDGLEAVDYTQVLPRLWYLYLVNLPKLRHLSARDLQGTMCLNSLRHLSLYKCSNLRHVFVPSMARCLPNLWEMEIKECDQMEGVFVDKEGQGSAMEGITFPNLERITLECLPNLTSFLSWKNHKLECPILSTLSIAHCPKMRSLTWQSSMEIDNGTPSLFTSQVQCPKLEQMDLSHMDNLSKIWSDSPQETLTFDNLWKMQVQNCRSLENVFPHWVATSLTQIKELQVESCEIEEIVTSGNETPHSNTTQDLFPKLTSLVLHEMPRLKNFCANLPTLNWPFLKELRVTHCDKANMLSFVASMSNWAKKDYQQGLSDQEAHSLFERDFPNLERLLLVDNNIQMIQDGNFPEDIFGKPKALTLACFHDEKAVFPLKFLLERFQNLQSLEVFCSSFEDIFLDEGLVDNGKHPVLESLEELKLNKLHNLKSVWREGSSELKILQSIKTFEVWDCPCLTTIFPTVTSFKNLTTLVVKNSSGLIHLVTASMVTNLVYLDYMTIIGCERMKEIVANDGDGEGKAISFENLEKLTLQNLPNLECFSSISSCIFRFPYLWNIEVEECPKMKTFSKGTLSTPGLKCVSLFRYKWDWNWEEGDDLNTAIQNYQHKTNAHRIADHQLCLSIDLASSFAE